jgi:hypothetical protein
MSDEPATSLTPEPEGGNPIAPVAVDLVRELFAVKLVSACQRDYIHWMQTETCKARDWTMPQLIHHWHQELDRRNRDRAFVMSSTERRAA